MRIAASAGLPAWCCWEGRGEAYRGRGGCLPGSVPVQRGGGGRCCCVCAAGPGRRSRAKLSRRRTRAAPTTAPTKSSAETISMRPPRRAADKRGRGACCASQQVAAQRRAEPFLPIASTDLTPRLQGVSNPGQELKAASTAPSLLPSTQQQQPAALAAPHGSMAGLDARREAAGGPNEAAAGAAAARGRPARARPRVAAAARTPPAAGQP